MTLVLCPRCELNYMLSTDRYCKVCLRDMNTGSAKDEVELCTICNESPALPGRDVCAYCLKEMKDQPEDEDSSGTEDVDTSSLSEMESMATMDDILPDVPEMEDKLPGDVENALSLESVREEEEKMAEEEENEDEEI